MRKGSILIFKNCSLNRPPGAISRLQSLEKLDLTDNNIRAIERGDVAHLLNLASIAFSGNPIVYIKRTAFFALPSLTSLDFTNTRITYIPKVILNLYSFETIDFTNAKLDCTCDMFWVKRWTTQLGKDIYTLKGNAKQWTILSRATLT